MLAQLDRKDKNLIVRNCLTQELVVSLPLDKGNGGFENEIVLTPENTSHIAHLASNEASLYNGQHSTEKMQGCGYHSNSWDPDPHNHTVYTFRQEKGIVRMDSFCRYLRALITWCYV